MRADLLALTPAALASLANPGLVMRAQRELASGPGPALAEAADGSVTGTFADGVVATLLPSVPLRDNPCSCRATTVCRHRVAVALAYPDWHRGRHGAAPEAAPGSPASIDDAALLRSLGRRALADARALVRGGCDVELQRNPPEARLPTAVVQFLAADDLAFARCTCARRQGCLHVALAVWAFRQAVDDASAPTLLVHLQARQAPVATGPLDAAAALRRELLVEGVAHLPPAIGARLSRTRALLERAGMTWPATIVGDLEQALADYRARSARYLPSRVAWLVAELAARERSARAGAEPAAGFVLGLAEARETPLDHVRLVALGAHVGGHGRERTVDVFLADAGSGLALVLQKRWTFGDDDRPEHGPALAERSVIPGVRLRELASGQLVTRAGHRLANRALRLGAPRHGTTAVMPLGEAWQTLPPPLLIADQAALAAELRARPPRLLRPRVLAESVHVVSVSAVGDIRYSPGDQALSATLYDATGRELALTRRHRAPAPYALESLAAALQQRHGRLRFVSGVVHLGPSGLVLDPIALVADQIVVPDLAGPPSDAPPEPSGSGAGMNPSPVPRGLRRERSSAPEPPSGSGAGMNPSPPDPTGEHAALAAVVSESWSCVEDGVHGGLRRSPAAWLERTRRCAERCDGVGLLALGAHLRGLVEPVRRLQAGEDDGGEAARAWEAATIRLALTQELLAYSPAER